MTYFNHFQRKEFLFLAKKKNHPTNTFPYRVEAFFPSVSKNFQFSSHIFNEKKSWKAIAIGSFLKF